MTTLTITIDGVTKQREFSPCPFCGSSDLTTSEWWLEDDQYDAIECRTCYAGAPAHVWNNRAKGETDGTPSE